MSEDGDISGMDEDSVRVAEYALGLLTLEEHAAVGTRLRTDRLLRSELGFWRSRLAGRTVLRCEIAISATGLRERR